MKGLHFLFFGTLIAIFAACQIGKNDLNNRTARLRIINASAISGGANLEVDYKLVYDKYCEYLNYSLFRDYIEGKHKIKVRDINTNVVFDSTMQLDFDKSYTLFIYDTLSAIRCKLIEEKFIVPIGANAKVRFLHLSGNADSVSLQKGNDSIPILSGFVNGMHSDYITWLAGPTYFTAIRAIPSEPHFIPICNPAAFILFLLKALPHHKPSTVWACLAYSTTANTNRAIRGDTFRFLIG